MKKLKKLISFMLGIVTVFSLSVTALALPPEEEEISPYVVQIFYINATNVNLRSGPSRHYSSGGLVSRPDRCEPRYINGSSYFADDHGESYEWRYIFMTSGQCSGLTGYVVSSYVGSNWIDSVD